MHSTIRLSAVQHSTGEGFAWSDSRHESGISTSISARFLREVIASINVVAHTNTTACCDAPRRKVELGLPEGHLGVVPTAGNIGVSFGCWEHVLVVNDEVFRAADFDMNISGLIRS